MSEHELPFYWGGYTRRGSLLHAAKRGESYCGQARSLCGLWLAGGAWEGFDLIDGIAVCRTCAATAYKVESK